MAQQGRENGAVRHGLRRHRYCRPIKYHNARFRNRAPRKHGGDLSPDCGPGHCRRRPGEVIGSQHRMRLTAAELSLEPVDARSGRIARKPPAKLVQYRSEVLGEVRFVSECGRIQVISRSVTLGYHTEVRCEQRLVERTVCNVLARLGYFQPGMKLHVHSSARRCCTGPVSSSVSCSTPPHSIRCCSAPGCATFAAALASASWFPVSPRSIARSRFPSGSTSPSALASDQNAVEVPVPVSPRSCSSSFRRPASHRVQAT